MDTRPWWAILLLGINWDLLEAKRLDTDDISSTSYSQSMSQGKSLLNKDLDFFYGSVGQSISPVKGSLGSRNVEKYLSVQDMHQEYFKDWYSVAPELINYEDCDEFPEERS